MKNKRLGGALALVITLAATAEQASDMREGGAGQQDGLGSEA